MLRNVQKTVQFLAKCRLVKNTMKCKLCGGPCFINYGKDYTMRETHWRCRKAKKHRNGPDVWKGSVFNGSYFHGKEVEKVLKVFYYFGNMNSTNREIAHETRCDHNTVGKYVDQCRKICSRWLQKNQPKLGKNLSNSINQ